MSGSPPPNGGGKYGNPRESPNGGGQDKQNGSALNSGLGIIETMPGKGQRIIHLDLARENNGNIGISPLEDAYFTKTFPTKCMYASGEDMQHKT